MKPRKVIITIGTTTEFSAALFRGFRGQQLRGLSMTKACGCLRGFTVDQIAVNVVREPKKKGTKR